MKNVIEKFKFSYMFIYNHNFNSKTKNKTFFHLLWHLIVSNFFIFFTKMLIKRKLNIIKKNYNTIQKDYKHCV